MKKCQKTKQKNHPHEDGGDFYMSSRIFDYIMPPMNAIIMVFIKHIQSYKIKTDNKRAILCTFKTYYEA